MIESIKNIFYIICAACVLASVYSILIPEGKVGNSVRICLMLTLFLAVLTPFTIARNTGYTFDSKSSTVNTSDAEKRFNDIIDESLRKAAETALQKNVAKEIQVLKIYSSKDQDGNIYIVKVIISYKGKDPDIRKKISSYLGGNVETVLSEEVG